MQLDNTRIAIRERNLLETFDLALRVVRRYPVPLLVTFFVGAVPLMIVHHLLIGWILDVEYRETYFYLDEYGAILRFIWLSALLVSIAAPLGSIFATAYLGQAVFVDQPRVGDVLLDVLKMFPRVAWCQLLVRGVLPAWLLCLALERYEGFNPAIEIFFLPMVAVYAVGLRSMRPYINEIVLLERNPLLSRNRAAITAGRRSTQLHGPSSSDLFGRGVLTAFLALMLTPSVFGSFVFVSGVFFNNLRPGPLMLAHVLPLSMWIVAGFLTVVRFLSYLDLRIRHEGWEVELRMRAEGNRMASKVL